MIRARAALLVLPAIVLSACSKGYQVEVRNACDHPVQAQLVLAGSGGRDEIRSSAHLGPGDRSTLVEHKAPGGYNFLLRVGSANNPGAPAQLNLAPGLTVVEVSQESRDQPLRLREIE